MTDSRVLCEESSALVDRYAWGAAMLAALHRFWRTTKEITLISQIIFIFSGNGNSTLGYLKNFLPPPYAFTSLLSMEKVFIMEYIPLTASLILHPLSEPNPEVIKQDKQGRPMGFPFLLGWHHNIFVGAKKVKASPTVKKVKKYFKNLMAAELNGVPTLGCLKIFLPPPYDQQVRLELAFTFLLSMEKAILHELEVCNGILLADSRLIQK
ncbi:hypothetical protein COLO4_05315 [Corchorus olitorius]|uniref:Uncharacterized protein n=1 Tax=Corchorus olitorius TaxID=93759 RepID=A0A1R3KRA5_9ROSI|nr:hypothetical protein COLO4_05315 [Corchorus olitorius]